MKDPIASLKTKRILVALDSSACGQAALQAAVLLATSIRAELEGLFVEDEDLVRLAGLPFAREIDVTSASTRPLQVADMERELRAVSEKTEKAFARALQQLDLAWKFRTIRGAIVRASLDAAGDADMLVIGQHGRSSRGIAADYLARTTARRDGVVAVFDGSNSAFRAIELGQTLARANSTALTVLVLSSEGEEDAAKCAVWLQQHSIHAEIDRSLSATDDALIQYVRKFTPGLLLINRDSRYLNESNVCEIINQFDCPLILC